MRSIVATPLRGFGGTTAAAEPAEPVVSVVDNEDGTVTVTITGSDGGSSNVISSAPYGVGALSFSAQATVVGDGSATFALPIGAHVFIADSTLNTLTTTSNVVVSLVTTTTAEFEYHLLADVIAQHFIDQGLGTALTDDSSWPVSVDSQPDMPDSAITVYNVAGRLQGRIQKTGQTLEHPGISIRVRARRHSVAVAKGKDIFDAIDGMNRTIVYVDGVGYRVESLSNTTSMLSIGVEKDREPGRQLITLNAIGTFVRL